MTDTIPPAEPPDAPPAQPPAPDSGFCFTDPGCRTDVRVGALLVLAAVFLWLWWGPTVSSRIYLVGVPFLLAGVPLQAFEARRSGRPGYPLKLGLVLLIGGGLMWPDLCYREQVGQALHVQEVAPLLVCAGAWMVGWWPLARTGEAARLRAERRAAAAVAPTSGVPA